MANKSSFTTEEWDALCDAPQLVGLAVALAGASGMTGTIKETFASSKAIVEGMQSDSELIRALCAREEVQAAGRGLRDALPQLKAETFAESQQKLATLALDRVRAAIAVLQAAKEGGFLGFGGERVSAAEEAMLAKLADALGGGA